MKIGMRTVKTAIAVSLSIFISQLLNVKSPFFAGIAAIITMQSSVSESFQTGKNRILGTILGAIFGMFFSLIKPENSFIPLIIGLGIILIICLCNIFNWKKAISISCIVFLAIILNQKEGSRLSYSLYRTVDTFIGIIIAMLVNYFIVPPKLEEEIKHSFKNILDKSNELIEELIWGDRNIELDCIKKILINLETNYNIFKKEFELNIYKNKESLAYKNIFTMFESLYNNLDLMSDMEYGNINETNKMLLEKIYKRKLPIKKHIDSDEEIDIIFNYHLNESLTQLMQLNNILSESLSKGELVNEI